MSRRDFFQIFCMFYLQCINRKCAKEKNIDIQRNTRVGLGCQFTSNRLSCHHMKFWWLKFHKGVQKGIFYDHRAINFKNIFSIQKNISTTARQLNILSGSFSNCKFCLLDPTGNCLDWSTTWPIHPFLRPAPYPSNLRTILINPKNYNERKIK